MLREIHRYVGHIAESTTLRFETQVVFEGLRVRVTRLRHEQRWYAHDLWVAKREGIQSSRRVDDYRRTQRRPLYLSRRHRRPPARVPLAARSRAPYCRVPGPPDAARSATRRRADGEVDVAALATRITAALVRTGVQEPQSHRHPRRRFERQATGKLSRFFPCRRRNCFSVNAWRGRRPVLRALSLRLLSRRR